MDLRTSDGNIVAGGLKGDLRLRSSDGSIEGNSLDGDCDAGTSDGHVHLTGRFDTLNIKSGDGGIEARVEPGSKMSRSWDIRSGDGSIELRLPEDSRPSSMPAPTMEASNWMCRWQWKARRSHSHVRGTLNSGGPALNIHSGDGSIRLKKL